LRRAIMARAAGWQWGCTPVAGIGVLGAESVDAGGLTEDLRRGQRAAPADHQQRRRKVSS
jgi:hypothetical protein